MKFVLALFLFGVLAAIIDSSTAGNVAGQSACQDQREVGQLYPHHIDPTRYWRCEKLGEAAIEETCPENMAYMHYLRECIPWASWIWKQPAMPLTLA